MSVQIATSVFGSEVLVALIAHYREHGGTQAEASRALHISQQRASASTHRLIEAGIVRVEEDPADRRASRHTVDLARLTELADAFVAYILGEAASIGKPKQGASEARGSD